LLGEGHVVQLASNGRSARWLADYFPQLEVHTDIPDYAIRYPANGRMQWHFVKDASRLFRVISAEHRWLKQFVERHGIDEVYSDNRYGLYHDRVTSSIITHQVFIRAPWYARNALHAITRHYLNQFTTVLIPDYPGPDNLSGALSHGRGLPEHAQYIGPQSRFEGVLAILPENPYDSVALISGPEPTRSLFQQQMLERFRNEQGSSVIICGTPEQSLDTTVGNVRMVSHLPDAELAGVLQTAGHIICRPGYSTIMDLHVLGCKAEFLPTVGQTEQEYLCGITNDRLLITD
jgi:hypothetical protein